LISELNLLLAKLENRHSNVIDLSLDRLIKIKKKLNIIPKFKIISVAGTNGKGSVCFYLNHLLMKAQNINVGLYTSPHFFSFNERIMINDQKCNDEEILTAINFILANDPESCLTFFEITTLAAIFIFNKKNIDIAVLEIGLGGRLDAVNAFEPDISIITSIGLDHTDYLGPTLNHIAYEKSGVMRENKICVCGEELHNEMIIDQAKIKKSILYIYNNHFSFESLFPDNLNFDLSIIQKKNLCCAVYALEKFGFSEIRQLVYRQDFFDKLFFGRFQKISKNPEIIIDVAHNEDSIKNLVNTLSSLDLKKTFLVFSILKDKNFKDYAGFFKTLKNQIEWFVAPLNSPRKESIDQLTKILSQNKFRFTSFLSIRDAYIQAINNAQKNDRIVVFGSFYVISEIFKDDYGGK